MDRNRNDEILVALTRNQEQLIAIAEDVAELKTTVSQLETQSQWVRGGLILIVAVGGIVTWLLDVFKRIVP